MSPRSRVTSAHRAIERLRQGYSPGATPHFIQAKHAWEADDWIVGVLEEAHGFELLVRLDEETSPLHLGTLWMDGMGNTRRGDVKSFDLRIELAGDRAPRRARPVRAARVQCPS